MLNVNTLSIDKIVKIFTDSDDQKRIAFVEAFPSIPMKEQALLAVKMTMHEMRAQALDFLAQGCTPAGPFELGANTGAACYRLAREGYEAGAGDLMVYRLIAGRGALNWMTCLQRIGRHNEIGKLIKEPIEWLESIGDEDNIDMLRLKRIESYIDLEDYDEAERYLNMIDQSSLSPMVKVTYNALKYLIDQHKGGGPILPEEQSGPSRQDLKNTLKPLIGSVAKDISDNSIDYDQYIDVAGEIVGRAFGGASGAMNEFTVRHKITEARRIFRDEKKGRNLEEIKKVEPVLMASRDWMKENNFPDSENDACWGLYLCYNRTQREDLAIIELQRIRANIEGARSKIAEPLERARLSERYPHIHAVECELLHKLGRNEDLLEAIEAGKSRALADLQTIRDGRPADERQFANAIRELPRQMVQLRSHYLTTFVDDEAVYCALVTSDGQIHTSRVELTKEKLTILTAIREPRLWGKKDPRDLHGSRNPSDVPRQLSPLVEWISPLLNSGVMKVGDHLCYSPHDTLLPVPFHYLELNGSPIVDHFSVSRVHGAHSLLEILRTESPHPDSYLVIEVPSVQDFDNQPKIEAFEKAGKWLQKHLPEGEQLPREKADLARLSSMKLRGQVVHFATHGTFPEQERPGSDPNPFRSSGLVLAAEGRLPDLMSIAKGQGDEHLLTPEKAVQQGFDFTGSHLTLQACVSGLSKRGYGGDALGLEWAFLQLGATSILSTHWNVSAQTTARFTERFYNRWLKRGENRASAWRNTVLELRKTSETSDPYHWAAFSLTGDWR